MMPLRLAHGNSAFLTLHTVVLLVGMGSLSCAGSARPADIPSQKGGALSSDKLGPTPTDRPREDTTVEAPPVARACLWNLKKLGHGKNKDYELVADIINEHCDLIVVVEMMQKQNLHPGFELLQTELSRLGTWLGTVTPSPRPNTSSGNSEFYAAFLRQGPLSFCEAPPVWKNVADLDGSAGAQGMFVREPAFVCVDFHKGDFKFDFLVGAFHATWDNGRIESIEAEVSALKPAILQLESEQLGEHDILLFGDMNLTTDLLERVTPLFRCPLQTSGSLGDGTTLRSDGTRTNNVYDHLLVVHPEVSPEVAPQGTILDVRHRADSDVGFYRTVSDHLPIVVELRLLQEDDD